LVADGVGGELQKQELPCQVRFFRRQMNNMIAKASGLGHPSAA